MENWGFAIPFATCHCKLPAVPSMPLIQG